jgi:hypothetical protein
MRLDRFLLEDWKRYPEPRSKNITLEEAVDYVLRNCKKSLDGSTVKRSVHGAWREPYRFTDPKVGEPRVSRNTANYYTYILDNSSKWSKYPQRSRSLICSIGSRTGAHYVFIEDGATIGLCPVWDFWGSFMKLGITDMDDFNRVIEEVACKSIDVCKRFDDSFNSMRMILSKIDASKRSDPVKFRTLTDKIWKESGRSWIKPYIYNPDFKFIDFLEERLDPEFNGFMLAKAGDKFTGNKEIWTSGKAVLVRENYLTDFLNELDRRNFSTRGELRKVRK